MSLYQRRQLDYQALDPLEQGRFGAESASLMRIFSNLHYQYLQGTLDVDEWLGFKATVDDLFTYSGFQAVWKLRKHHYSKDFQEYIDSTLATGASRKAKLYPDPEEDLLKEAVPPSKSE